MHTPYLTAIQSKLTPPSLLSPGNPGSGVAALLPTTLLSPCPASVLFKFGNIGLTTTSSWTSSGSLSSLSSSALSCMLPGALLSTLPPAAASASAVGPVGTSNCPPTALSAGVASVDGRSASGLVGITTCGCTPVGGERIGIAGAAGFVTAASAFL